MSNNKQEQSLNKKTQQSLVWYTTVPMLLHFIRFANSIILARLLLPEDFGIVGIATILLYLSNSITNFGFSRAIVQRKNITQQHYNVYFSFNLGLSILLYFVFNYFSQELASYFHEPKLEPAIEVIALLFLITAMVAVPMTVHNRNINFKILTLAEILKVFVSICLSLTLALSGYGFWSIIYAMVVSSFVSMLFIRLSCSMRPKLFFQFKYFKDLFKFGVWDFLSGQSSMLSDNIDKILIGRALDVTQLGFYEKAQGLAKMPNEQFSRRLGVVSFAAFSRIQDDPEQLKNYFTKMMVVNAFFCFPIYVGLFAVAENFTLVLLGDKWEAMIDPLKVLSASLLVASVTTPMISMNIAMGNIKQQTLLRMLGLMLFVVVVLWVVPFGILMVSYATLGFNMFLLLTAFYLLKKHFNITVSHTLWCLYPAMFGSLVLFVLVTLTTELLLSDAKSLNLIAEIFVGVFSYSMCAILIPFKQWDFIRRKTLDRLVNHKYVIFLKSHYYKLSKMLK